MKLLLYSKFQEHNIQQSLGMPEYSYFFVFKEFYRVIKDRCELAVIDDPDQLKAHVEGAKRNGDDCRLIVFAPPHKAPPKPACRSYIVFAWEFDTLPDGAWSDDPLQDWAYALSEYDGAITLSEHSAKVVRAALGDGYPVTAIPVPVWSKFQDARREAGPAQVLSSHSISLHVDGNVVDSNSYRITPDEFELAGIEKNINLPRWDGASLDMPVSMHDKYNSYLVGFYAPELWGAWSRIADPSYIIPIRLVGRLRVEIECVGYNAAAHQTVTVCLGDQQGEIQLLPHFSIVSLELNLAREASLLRFKGVDGRAVPGAADPRSMGMGIKRIKVHKLDELPVLPERKNLPVSLTLSGAIYTSVFNPVDDRKNWPLLVSAFCYTFRDNPDVVLVLKITHASLAVFLGKLHYILQQNSPFRCRIVAIHGYLDTASYNQLIAGTHYYVNSSSAEGLCLPLMEYLSSEKPAIAPKHTAMDDYVSEESCFVIDTSTEPAYWPPDPSERYRATQQRVHFDSLAQKLAESLDVLTRAPDRYAQKARHASEMLEKFSADDVVRARLAKFVECEIA